MLQHHRKAVNNMSEDADIGQEENSEISSMMQQIEENKKKYEFIEDLPGVGPATAGKLRELGYHTVESLAMATSRELDPVGVSEKKAFQIIQAARSSIGISFIRADELYKMRKAVLRLSSGSKALDKILAGGLETQTITEYYGEFGSGKSQMCHQLCINVQLPPERGGLNGGVLYVDTENTFRLERIVQMAKFVGLDPEQAVKNIIYAEAYTSDHQMFLLENADEIIKANNIRLIIIDSLTAHFRSEYIGREMLASRQQRLNKHMHKLTALARAFNAVAVVTNQVMAKPDQFFGDAIHPIGGNIVGHTSHTRVYLRRASHGPIRIARLVSSPYLPEGEEILKVTENGIEDVSEEEKATKSRGR
jgi:DNA repair protein RadA